MDKNVTKVSSSLSVISIITPLVTVIVVLGIGFSIMSNIDLLTTPQSANTTFNNPSNLFEFGIVSFVPVIVLIAVIIGLIIGIFGGFGKGSVEDDIEEETADEIIGDIRRINSEAKSLKKVKQEKKPKDKIDFDYNEVLKDDNLLDL